MVEKIFYQSSLPKSGDIAFQNIMAQNPDFYCTPTSGVLDLLLNTRTTYTVSPEFIAQDNELIKQGFTNFCKEGMNSFYNTVTDKKYVLDNNGKWGINYDFLNLVQPNPKIICVVRDLRDIFTSMEKSFRQYPEKQSAILDWSKGQGTTIPKRIDIWSSSPPVGSSLEMMTEIFRMGLNNKMLFVKFEDLCLYPDSTMVKVYEYLELPYFKHDFDNIEETIKDDDEIHKSKLEPIRSKSNELLGKDISKWIYDNYRWFFDHLNYSK